MKINTIASALVSPSPDDVEKLFPNELYCDEYASEIESALNQAQTLKRQRKELRELMPSKAKELDYQFNETVLRLARELHEKIFEPTL